ncbi:MAG TPA: hypothetical protein VKC53_02425 [Patescibacteria group bacterium]|nr:hypothetical protein [Patescibacteria group bacterium]
MRLSKHFKLGKTQPELDFVDVPLNTDIPLFIDPYALSKRSDLFSMESSNILVNFFQLVIDDIKNGNFSNAKANLDRLREPNETRFGLSRKKPKGKGVSGKQSIDVFEKLKNSKAVKTGFLKDLSDCELLIPGIGTDKISDMVTNIIKVKLLEYTEDQCNTYNIPTEKVSSGKYWNPASQIWEEDYKNLPIYKNSKIILIPKAIARYSLEYNHQKFYNRFVLEYLQQEHINANTGLVRLLKDKVTKVVYKKDLKADSRYKLSKEFLYEFANAHPDVLRKYFNSLPKQIPSLRNSEIEGVQRQPKQDLDYDLLIKKLSKIKSGSIEANEYHNTILGILSAVFYPNLIAPTKEEPIHNGRKRIDITFMNAPDNGFFQFLTTHFPCPFVVCECKNYTNDPANPELDQLSGRFAPNRGKFGFLICRDVSNKALMLERCRDTAKDDRGFIIALDDKDVINLLEFKRDSKEDEINMFLISKFKELI